MIGHEKNNKFFVLGKKKKWIWIKIHSPPKKIKWLLPKKVFTSIQKFMIAYLIITADL